MKAGGGTVPRGTVSGHGGIGLCGMAASGFAASGFAAWRCCGAAVLGLRKCWGAAVRRCCGAAVLRCCGAAVRRCWGSAVLGFGGAGGSVPPAPSCFTVRQRQRRHLHRKHLRNFRPPTTADHRTSPAFGAAPSEQDTTLQALADLYRTTLIMLSNAPEGCGSRCVATSSVTDIRFLDTLLRGWIWGCVGQSNPARI